MFRAAFNAVELPYEMELSGEEIKAWSQNLGHEKLDTSVNNYGPVSRDRQWMQMLAMHKRPIEQVNAPPFDFIILPDMVENAVSNALKT